MATEQYFFTDTKASGINHLDTQTSAFTNADSTTGWSGSGGGVVANRYSGMFALVARARTTFGSSAVPTTIDTTNGNGWRLFSTAKSGFYAAGSWSLSFRLKAISGVNASSDCGVTFLFWRSANADGSSGSVIGTQQVTSYATNIGTAGSTVTASYDPSGGSGITLSNEYIFVLAGLQSDPGGTGMGTDTIGFRIGGSNHSVTTTNFSIQLAQRPTIYMGSTPKVRRCAWW